MNYSNISARLSSSQRAKLRKPVRQPRPPRTARSVQRPATAATAALLLLASINSLTAETIHLELAAPSMDKWIYPFAQSGGGPRTNASTFGAIGSTGFDDRDAQFFNRFDTASIIPAGQGADNYHVLSATFTLSIRVGDVLVFDPTYDSISAYDATGAQANGDDAGRSIELYGAAYRNGITRETVTENLSFGTPGEGTRNIFATDFLLGISLNGSNRDVSNNVSAGFDPQPFAIGQVSPSDLNLDGTVKADANVVFTLNLANPDVLRYLQLSLDAGTIDFLATSLHTASQGGPVTYPDYYTKENLLDGLPGRLDVQVEVVPEPSAVTLLLCGLGVFVSCLRGRQVLREGAPTA